MPDAPGNSKSIWGFDPRTIPGCVLWLDAADSNMTGGGSTISTWIDKSGLGSNATANSAITLTQNAMGGLPALSFNASTPQWLLGNTSITSNTLTVCSVFSLQSGAGAAARLIGLAATGANDYNNNSYVGILRQNGTTMGPDRNGAWLSGSFLYSTPVVNVSLFDGTTAYLYTNGLAQGTYASTGNFAISAYAVAANTNTADAHYWSGYIGEVIVYSSALTTAQRQQVEGYLAWKWLGGIPPNLLNFKQLTSAGSRNYSQPVFSSNLQTGLMYPPASGTTYAFYPYTTSDGGNTWTQSTSAGAYVWSCTSVSPDGSTMYVGQYVNPGTAGNLFKSTNGGTSWTQVAAGLSTTWQSVSCSSNAQIVYAPHGTGCLISSNSGSTWITSSGVTSNCVPSCCSWDGTKAYMGGFGGYIARTSNTGITWTTVTSSPLTNTFYFAMACSSDGTKVAATGGTNSLYLSSDSGVTWVICSTISGVVLAIQTGLAMSADGNTLYVMLYTGFLYKSTDFGGSWTLQTGITFATSGGYGTIGGGVKCSRDGNTVYCCTNSGTSSAIPYSGTPRSAHPFYSIKPRLRTFQPVDIDGCALWLDGADATTITGSASAVTGWNDKSGNGRNLTTQGTSSYITLTTLSNYPALLFNNPSSQNAYMTTTSFPTLTTGSVFMVFTPLTYPSATWNFIWSWRPILSTNLYLPGVRIAQSNNNLQYYITYYGSVDDGTVSNGTRFLSYFDWTGGGSSVATNWSLNGTTPTAATVGRALSAAVNQFDLGSDSGTAPGNFYISELIMFDSVITSAQRQQVEGYLAKKWNLTTIISPFTNPTSISNCTLWLDAQDSSTITGTTTVTQWRDKSSLGSNTTGYVGTPALVTNAINGYQAMSFNGSSYFYGSNSNTTDKVTFFCVGVESSAIIQYGTTMSLSRVGVNAFGDGVYSIAGGGSAGGTGASSLLQPGRNGTGTTGFDPGYNTPFVLSYVVDGTNWYAYGDGALMGSNASSGNFAYTKYVVGGTETTTGPGLYPWKGYIGEVIVYNAALTATERQRVEYYLATKWNLLTVNSFAPTEIYGCKLWLDAADSSTITGTTTVTQWKDKSYSQYHAVGYNNTGSYSATGLNGRPGIAFSSTKSMVAPVPAGTFPTALSAFVVYQFTGTASSSAVYSPINRTASQANPTAAPFSIYQNSGSIFRYLGGGTNQRYSSALGMLYTTTTPIIYYFSIASNANTTWNESVNGTVTAYTLTTGTTGYADTASNVCIGGRLDTAVYMDGVISEVIMYNTTLTTAQRQQVEYYLANKWGVNTVATFSPTTLSTCAIWFDAADTSTITATGGTTLATWSNKGGAGGSAAPAAGTITTNVATWAGRNIVRLPQSSSLSVTLSIPNQPRSFFAVYRQTTQRTAASPYFNIFANYSTSGGTQLAGPEYTSGGFNLVMYRGGIDAPIVASNTINGYNTFNLYTLTNSAASTASNRIAVNGTTLPLSISATATGYSTASLVYNMLSSGHAVGVDIAELICINGEITTLEQQQMEYYLAQKWGLSLSNNFSPLQIPSCALWLDALQDTTTPGSYVTTLPDRSGNGNMLVPYSTNTISLSGNALNGLPVYNFGTGMACNSSFYWGTTFTQFVVVKGTGNWLSCTFNGSAYNNFINAGNWNLAQVAASAGANTFAVNDSVVAQGTSVFTTTTGGASAWTIFCLGYSAGSTTVSNYTLNGVSRASLTGTAASGTPPNYQLWLNGRGGTSFDTTQVAELIHFNTALTATQRQQVEYYLAQKWGLPLTFNFSPLQIPSCALWLDAADTTSFNSGSITAGTGVSSWNDKSGRVNHAVQATAGNRPTYASDSGYPAVNFSGSGQYLFGTNPLLTSTSISIFIVARTTTTASTQYLFFDYKVLGSNYVQFGIDSALTPAPGWFGTFQYTTSPNAYKQPGYYQATTSRFLLTARDSPGQTSNFYANGTLIPTVSSGTDTGNVATDAVGYGLGAFRQNLTTAYSGFYFQGYINEVIVYLREVTTTERQQIEYYLAKKWGISGPPAVSYGPPAPAYYGPPSTTYGPPAISFAGSTTPKLPTTHPFVTRPPATALPFSPLNISGCCLWLDANDPDATGVQPSPGALAIWRDKSGSYNHMTAVGTNPTFSNFPPASVTFGGAGYYSNATPVFSNTYTAFFVYKQTASSVSPLYTTGASSGSNGLFPNESGTTYFTRGDSTWYTTTSPFASNVVNLAVVSFSSNAVGGSQALFYNGSNVVTTTQANTITYTNLLLGSRQSGGTAYFAGSMYEVVGYAGTLTTGQRQRVEGYLAQKWKF